EHSNCGESVGGCGPLLKVPCKAFGGEHCNYEAINEQGFCQGCRGEEIQDAGEATADPDLTTMASAPVSGSQTGIDPQSLSLSKTPQPMEAEVYPSGPSSDDTSGMMTVPAPPLGEHVTVRLPGMDSKPSSAATAEDVVIPAASANEYITVKLPGMSSRRIVAPASKDLSTSPSSPSRIVTMHRDGQPSVQEGSPDASVETGAISPEAQKLRLLITALQSHWVNVCVVVTGSDAEHDSDTLNKITDLAWQLGTNSKPKTQYIHLAAGSHDTSAHAEGDTLEQRQARRLITVMHKHWQTTCQIGLVSQKKSDRKIVGQIITLASYLGSGRKPIERCRGLEAGQTESQAGTAGDRAEETSTETLNQATIPTQSGDELITDKDVVVPSKRSTSATGPLHQALASAQARAAASTSSPTSAMVAGMFPAGRSSTSTIDDAQWTKSSLEHHPDTNGLQ
ncbi:MAG: hypothetical protein Q9174_006617, partial [Haloplaca sp. 1 TL-2023]